MIQSLVMGHGSLVADAVQTAVDGGLVLKIIGGIFSGVALLMGGRHLGKKEGENSREVTVKKPVPTIQVREELHWATKPDLQEHIERTKEGFDQVWEAITAERGVARESLGKIHARIDAQSKATATLQGTVDEVKSNVRTLLDIALNNKPRPRN